MTGHPKAAAAAWMLNGCLQAMNDAMIPGNGNADTVDDDLEKYSHLVFPTRCIHVREIKAFLLNSFGFGQKGGQVVGISPKYLFGALSKSEMDEYIVKVTERKRKAKRAYIRAIATNNVVQIKQSSPYEKSDASRIYLDPLARIPRDVEKDLQFKTSNLHGLLTKESKAPRKFQCESSKFIGSAMKDWAEMTLSQNNNKASTVGVDVEEIDSFSHNNHNFINRNFTAAEQSYSAQSVNPKLTLAGRWCSKEAVFKSLRLPSAGAGSPMIDIEIVNDRGMPVVKLHGDAHQAATKQGIESFQLSLSHNETTVMAVALAFYGSGNITY